MKNTLIFILIVGLGFVAFRFVDRAQQEPVVQQDPEVQNPDSVAAYVSQNISALSPEKEVLGGKFYVTNIDFDSGSGMVEYEDGHNAYVANFTYIYKQNGEVEITGFELAE